MRWIVFTLVTLCMVSCMGLGGAAIIDVGEDYKYASIQAGVNAASAGDTVLVHAGTYNIDTSIMAKSGITIKGEGDKSIIYTDDFDDISNSENMAMIYCNGVSNVEICDITFVGPAEDLDDQHNNGGIPLNGLRESRNAIMVRSSDDVDIHDIKVSLILSDGVRITGSNNVNVYDSEFNCPGHDGVSVFKSSEVVVDNCYINIMINTGIRYDGAENCVLSNCTFDQSLSGTGAGFVELEHSANNILITKNAFLESADPVIWTVYAEGGEITITNNAMYKNDGIRSSYSPYEVTVSNNIQFATERDWVALGYGYNGDITRVEKPGKPEVSDNEVSKDDNNSAEPKPVEKVEKVEVNITDENGMNYTVEVEPIDVCNETTVIENCSNEFISENCSVINEVSGTVIIDIQEIARMYLESSQENVNISIELMQSGNNDTLKAAEFMNGTVEEQAVSIKMLESSEIKLRCAQELLNLSLENIEAVKQ